MNSEPVLSHRDPHGVATLTLNRPAVHNAFDEALIAALTDCLTALAGDPAVRAVVLRAAGHSFSAGADLNWMRRAAAYGDAENIADAERLGVLLQTLATLPKPTVAVVQGAAIGGGAGLVAACDVVIAAERARFAFSEVRLGLIPAVISPVVIAAIGARAARRYFLTAERFDASTARGLGLVHEVVAEEALDETLERTLGLLLANAPQAMAAAKSLVSDVAGRRYDQALMADLAHRIAARRASPEGREGLAAFLEKRPPRWPERR